MIDDQEMRELMEILEDSNDEVRAVELLREFNQKSAQWGRLFLNKDHTIPHEDWKKRCDQAEKELLDCVTRIKKLHKEL